MGKLVSGPFAVVVLLFTLLAAACSQQPADTQEARMASPFFDLRTYIQGEIERLNRLQPSVVKKVSIDSLEEIKTLDSLNYADELQVFLNADINRPTWWDKYSIDSVQNNGDLQEIRYEAADPELQIRNLRIEWRQGQVSKIFATRESKSPTAHLHYEMIFEPTRGYQVLTRQDVALSEPREMRIEVQFAD